MNLKRTHFPFKNDLNLLFENALKGYSDESFVDTGTWEPAVDIKEEQNRFLVIADIPGVQQEDIHIALENSLLTIHGERIIEKKEDKKIIHALNGCKDNFTDALAYPKQQMSLKSVQNTNKESWRFQSLRRMSPCRGKFQLVVKINLIKPVRRSYTAHQPFFKFEQIKISCLH